MTSRKVCDLFIFNLSSTDKTRYYELEMRDSDREIRTNNKLLEPLKLLVNKKEVWCETSGFKPSVAFRETPGHDLNVKYTEGAPILQLPIEERIRSEYSGKEFVFEVLEGPGDTLVLKIDGKEVYRG